MDFYDFINEKGVKVLAAVFDCPPSTIYSFARRNCIPRKRWDRLIEVYGLKYRDLVDMERASESERV